MESDASIQSAKILLIEDDPNLLQGYSDLLQLSDIGYNVEVVTAENGEEGLQALERFMPDLIISDITMPKMNGYEFMDRVKANRKWVHIPVIYLSARNTDQDVARGKIQGAVRYIVKTVDSGTLLEFIRTQLDHSFRKQADRRRELEQAKHRLIDMINHEMRTPLTYVTAYHEMFREALVDSSNEELQNLLRGILAGCTRLNRLIANLIKILELRMGETRQAVQEKAQLITDFAALLQEQILQYEVKAAAEDVALTAEIPETLPPIWGDADSLIDVVARLVSNAIKFTRNNLREEKQITIRAYADEQELFVEVKDTGVGFPNHLSHQLFELFYQYNREYYEQQGAGTGLTIAKELINLHNGYIKAESEEGKGSLFTAVLPVFTENTSDKIGHFTKRQATILVVEDDKHLLEGLYDIITIAEDTPFHFRVLTANNGQAGLDVLANQKPDLIICDIMMPVMGGYEFWSHVQQVPQLTQVPFIFLTAKANEVDVHKGLLSGVDDYITKPYDIDYLMQMVVSRLERYFATRMAMTESLNDLKDDILRLLNREFEMPLSAVTIHTQKMSEILRDVHDEEDLKGSLQEIQSGSNVITQLIEDFIQLAEIKTGEAVTAFESRATLMSDLGVILYEAGLHSEQAAAVADIQINCPLVLESPVIYGDAQSLAQSLRRLTQIALHFTKKGGGNEILLAVEPLEEEVQVCIYGYQTCLDEAEFAIVQSLLENEAENDNLPEYGPGLTIARFITQLHGGRLEVTNDLEQGFAFCTCLPIYQSTPGILPD